MKLLLLAGEESGVLYAKEVARELLERNPAWEIRGYGDYGFEVSDLAVMGLWAVLKRLGFFLRVKRTMERAIDEWQPDVICTIDYPDMNLKLAAYAKARGVKAVHVVCPQVWAWRKGRIPKIEAALDKLLCFFPFEPACFRPGFAEFVGHPLVDTFKREQETAAASQASVRQTVALLPGSRVGEIERNLRPMLEAVKDLGVDVIIPAANPRARQMIERECSPEVKITDGGAREALRAADCAVVVSGTATLEAALARCPTVLVYRAGPITAWVLRRLIKGIKHIGIANLIWEKSGGSAAEDPMPELLQEDFTVPRVRAYLKEWLSSPDARARQIGYIEASLKLLVSDGSAMSRIASSIERMVK